MGLRLRGLLLVLAVAARLEAAPTEAERLGTVGRLWGEVKFFHPWLRYKAIDWDDALVRTLPRIRAAATDDELAAAVGDLLGKLGDPVTRVERVPEPKTSVRAAGTAAQLFHWEGQVLVVTLASVPEAMEKGGFRFSQPLKAELAKADRVLVDARLAGADRDAVAWGLSSFDDQIAPTTVQAPASRAVFLNGYPPQTGFTSGGYYQGFVVTPGDLYAPDKEAPGRRVVFLVEPQWVPGVAEALAAAGQVTIVATGPLADTAPAATVALPGGFQARLRVAETLGVPVEADVELVEGQEPLAVAVALASDPAPPRRPAAAVGGSHVAQPPAWRPDPRYDGMEYPPPEYRLLAVFRLWNTIRYFYPYLELIDDWEPVLGEFVPKALAAADGKVYALTMLEMAARVADGHTRVSGSPAIDELLGAAGAPVQVRIVEGQPTVAKLHHANLAAVAGVRLGDVIVAVEGEPAEAKMARLAPYVSASTPEARRARLAGLLLRGAEGATLAATVRGADGESRRVALPLSAKPFADGGSEPPPYRALSPEIGYADLTKLVPSQVDAMFDSFKGTKGLVLDMRGYPNGTAWSIAPRINVKRAKIGARFRRPLWDGFQLLDGDVAGSASYAFEQPLPPTTGDLYSGRTVMLIDERAISQSEHSGLFFEAAADTTFVGTPTAGANGDVTVLTLPGGLEVRFTGHDVRHADGRQLQRVGLQPHVHVAPTIAGIRAGQDEVLERAVEYLRTGR